VKANAANERYVVSIRKSGEIRGASKFQRCFYIPGKGWVRRLCGEEDTLGLKKQFLELGLNQEVPIRREVERPKTLSGQRGDSSTGGKKGVVRAVLRKRSRQIRRELENWKKKKTKATDQANSW